MSTEKESICDMNPSICPWAILVSVRSEIVLSDTSDLRDISSWSHDSSHTRPERLLKEQDTRGINQTWMKRTMKQIKYKLFFGSPRLRRERWGDEEWFSEWAPSITHFRGRRNSGENRLNARRKTAVEINQHTEVGPHSWAQNCFSSTPFLN